LSTEDDLLIVAKTFYLQKIQNNLKGKIPVHGPKSEIIPPGGIFVDPHIFVVWTLVFKNLVVGCKIDAG